MWVAVDQQGECIRYYHSTAGGVGPEVVVFFSTEVASTNARGEVKPYDFYVKQTPAAMQDRSAGWSRSLRKMKRSYGGLFRSLYKRMVY